MEERIVRQEDLPGPHEGRHLLQARQVAVDGGKVPVGWRGVARPAPPDLGEGLGSHERVGVDVIGDLRVGVGDVDPGRDEGELVGLGVAGLGQGQGDDRRQASARAITHEDDPFTRVLGDRAPVEVQHQPVRLLPGVMGCQRIERHDETGPRPAGEVVDQPGMSRDRRRDVSAAVEVDDDRVRRRMRADVVDGHARVFAPLQVVEEAPPGGEGDGSTRLGTAGQAGDPVGDRHAGVHHLDRPGAVLRQARRGRAPIALAGVEAEGAHRQTDAGHADGDPAPADRPEHPHDSSAPQDTEHCPKTSPDPVPASSIVGIKTP